MHVRLPVARQWAARGRTSSTMNAVQAVMCVCLQEALSAVKEVAAEQGRQRDYGGLSCPTNVAIVVTATA
jgi:hypothetical protein